MGIFSMNLHCLFDSWETRLGNILDKAIELDSEILNFQEVCVDDDNDMSVFIADYLRKKTKKHWEIEKVFTHKSWGKYDEYILMATTKPVEKTVMGSLPYSPLRRSFLAMKINGTFYINIHLEHKADYHRYRVQQIKFLVGSFKGTKHLFMGDFNSSPKDYEQKKFYAHGYQEYFPGKSYPSSNPRKAIDGVWLSKNFFKAKKDFPDHAKLVLAKPIKGLQSSDHLGLFIDL